MNSELKPITRQQRIAVAQAIFFIFEKQKEFSEFVLSKNIETEVGKLDHLKLPILLNLPKESSKIRFGG